MKIYVLSGGPGTGKTTLLNELKKFYPVLEEAARFVGDNHPDFIGKSIKEIGMEKFQLEIFNFQKKQLSHLDKKEKIIFTDRSVIDTIAYYKIHNLPIPKEVAEFANSFRYTGIFILDFLKNYKQDSLRQETKSEQEKIHNLIIKTYKEFGYAPIIVPDIGLKNRLDFVLKRVAQ
jgi:predicted ATPase